MFSADFEGSAALWRAQELALATDGYTMNADA
jgi:hypothetical protein